MSLARTAWQVRRIQLVVVEPPVREWMRVLAHPKFRLNAAELEQLFADLLLWRENRTAPLVADPC